MPSAAAKLVQVEPRLTVLGVVTGTGTVEKEGIVLPMPS
jgi:hypothetical protein